MVSNELLNEFKKNNPEWPFLTGIITKKRKFENEEPCYFNITKIKAEFGYYDCAVRKKRKMEVNNTPFCFSEDDLVVFKTFIDNRTNNMYEGTAFENYYACTTKAKGDLGELHVKRFCDKELGFTVTFNPEKNGPYDLLVHTKESVIKTEVKSTGATVWMVNHIGLEKDFERLVFVGFKPDMTYQMKWIEKTELVQFTKSTSTRRALLNKQQGGGKQKNDDWMISGNNLSKLLTFMKPMSAF